MMYEIFIMRISGETSKVKKKKTEDTMEVSLYTSKVRK